MEDFIDYILFFALILVIGFTSLIIFFLIKDPIIGYALLYICISAIIGGIGLVGWNIYRKRRLGKYHVLLQELAQAKKDIYRSTGHLERYSRKTIKNQFSKIRQLCRESRKRLNKIIEIDKALSSFKKKQFSENAYFGNSIERDKQATEKRQASHKRYQQNIRRIEGSKQQYLQEVQEVIRFLHELNSQILALKYSHEKRRIQTQIAETIDELLIDIQTLEEMT